MSDPVGEELKYHKVRRILIKSLMLSCQHCNPKSDQFSCPTLYRGGAEVPRSEENSH